MITPRRRKTKDAKSPKLAFDSRGDVLLRVRGAAQQTLHSPLSFIVLVLELVLDLDL